MASTVDRHTSLIEADENLLRPVHGAHIQLDFNTFSEIRTSPYFESGHLLELSSLPLNYQIISFSLQSLAPIAERKYAFVAYIDAFNISTIVKLVREYCHRLQYQFPETKVYVIAFRSILHKEVQKSSEKRQFLADIDRQSHIEANQSGGLLKYWFGTPDDVHGQNLATCWWKSKSDAKAGGGGKAHREGMKKVKDWFETWKVEEYEFIIHDNVQSYSFEPLVESSERI